MGREDYGAGKDWHVEPLCFQFSKVLDLARRTREVLCLSPMKDLQAVFYCRKVWPPFDYSLQYIVYSYLGTRSVKKGFTFRPCVC